jgi:hypothetical protein
MRLKTREDHRSLTVRTKWALARGFAVEKRGNGTIEHNASPWLGGSVQHSQSPINAEGGAVMELSWNLSSTAAGQYCSLARIRASYPQLDLSQDILIFHQFNSGRGRHQYNQRLASNI